MRRPPAFLLACAVVLQAAPLFAAAAEDSGASYEEYRLKKKQLQSAEDSVRQFEKRVERAGSTYDRLQAQRQLEMARKSLRDAKRDFESVKRRIQPGDRAFEEETRFEEGNPREALENRPSGPRVPFVIYSEAEPTRGGSTGEVVYNMRRAPNYGAQTRLDPGRWKLREKGEPQAPPEASPADGVREAVRPGETPGARRPAREQYVLTPEKLGGAGSRRPQGKPIGEVDFVGGPAQFDFVPFDDPREAGRKTTEGESVEELALIESVKRHMKEGRDSAAQEDVERLLKLRAGDARVHHLASLVYQRRKRYADAERAAKNALRIGMEHPAVYESLALAQLARGREESAFRSAEKALSFDPSRGLAASVRAEALARLKSRGVALDAPASAAGSASPVFGGVAAGGASGAVAGAGSATASVPRPFPSGRTARVLSPAVLGGAALFSVLCAAGGFFLLRRGG